MRVWPGVAAATLICAGRYALPFVAPSLEVYGILAGVAGAVAILVWWLFFSRAPWSDRAGALAAIAAACLVTWPFLHKTVSLSVIFTLYALPLTLGPAFVAWAVVTRRSSDRTRRASMVITILLSTFVWTLFRLDGVKGNLGSQVRWRATPTAEERLLMEKRDEPAVIAPSAPAAASVTPKEAANATSAPPPIVARKPADWPGFRGPLRDGVVRGVTIGTDWTSSPPVLMWKHAVGPGWSSFAVDGDLLYTQEQRGDDEVVSCYRISTGQAVWRHRDRARFEETAGGPGPRATPTVVNGRVYAMGATGIFNALDAATGAVMWTRNTATDTKRTIPDWGLASSPLVIDDVVVAAAAGHLVAYDVVTGTPRWFGPAGGGGYSSPHLATISGVPQILLIRGTRMISVSPRDGTLLWQHEGEPATIVQPGMLEDGGVLVAAGDVMGGGSGIRRVSVTHGRSGWTVEERWTSRGLKPFFNDFVVHKGHAYGFDGNILSCVDLTDGSRKWKGGRYGNGQLVLLADEDLMVVLSEDGDLALVKAVPDEFTEVAKVHVLDGKTWNHPVVVRDTLLVRNGEEMAAFRLPRATATHQPVNGR